VLEITLEFGKEARRKFTQGRCVGRKKGFTHFTFAAIR
jgi:hypothetical protein